MEFRDDSGWNYQQRVFHPGTFNANPLSSAAGATMLSLVETGRFHAAADAMNERLVGGMNEAIASRGVKGCAYGLASYFHISLGRECPQVAGTEWPFEDGKAPPRTPTEVALPLKQGMLNRGVDLMGMTGGLVSGVHSDEDVDRSLEAFEATLAELQAEGLI
jgi:glutamate-1-semialdehyde 2,1-aminomutase